MAFLGNICKQCIWDNGEVSGGWNLQRWFEPGTGGGKSSLVQRMRESSCPLLLQGEERGVFLQLWRRDEWHAGLLSVRRLAFVITLRSRVEGTQPFSGGLRYLQIGALLSASQLRYSAPCLLSQGHLWLLVQQLVKEGRRGIVHSAEPEPAPAGGHVCISLCTRVLVHLSE